jgi:predicted ATPase
LVQCKKFEEGNKDISRDNVYIYHFDRDETEHCTKATKVEIKENGRLINQPKGFFDQISIDLEQLMGF